MEGNEIKISVIIPIYNAEKYLHNTLHSVVSQSLKDIEIICVDDCSPDNSREIVETFSSRDDRIKLISLEKNEGVGIARKIGIRKSHGQYILFLDADDFLHPNACKELYHAITQKNADILQFGTTIIPSEEIGELELQSVEKHLAPPANTDVLENSESGGLVNFCFTEKKFGFTLWNKIYRGEIVRHAVTYYKENRYDLGEDMYLFFLVAFFSKSYAAIPTKYYNYNFGAGITGGKILSERTFVARAKIGEIISNLQEIADKYDSYGYTAQALDNLRDEYVEGIIWGLLYQNSTLDKADAIKYIFQYFDHSDALAELITHYRRFSDSQKKEFLEICRKSSCFVSRRRKVKTIGTFYYRITNGGLERVMALLINLWHKMGYNIVLFTEELPSPQDYAYPANVQHVVVPHITKQEKSEYHRRAAFWKDALDRYHVDVMVYHAWVSEELEADILPIKKHGTPIVVHTHGLFCHGVGSAAARYAYGTVQIYRPYQLADAVITLSETDYSWWSMLHPCVYKTVNPLTFDIQKIQPKTQYGNNLLYLGRIQNDKRVEDTLKILKLVLASQSEAKLHIVGKCEDAQYEKFLNDQIRELKLEDHVTMHGYQTDVKKYYENADIYLMTSAFEGFGMTLVESMAFGVPAVVYDLPNVDLVQKGKGIQVVAQKDTAAAAKIVTELLSDKQKLAKLGSDARQSVEEIYSMDFSAFWDKVFAEVCSPEDICVRVPEYRYVKNAVNIMLEYYLAGVEAREKELSWYKNHPSTLPEQQCAHEVYEYPGDTVLRMYEDGVMGFNYIFRFIKAYIKYKITRKRPER